MCYHVFGCNANLGTILTIDAYFLFVVLTPGEVFRTLLNINDVHFFTPDTYVHVSGGKKCSFFRKFDLLCFLETLVLRFAFLPYHRLTDV